MEKLTFQSIKSSFEKEDYTLLNKTYVNSKTKLDYICPKGHKHSMNWNSWQQGKRCPTCAGQTKPTYEFVKTSFESEGYTLLSKEYINNRQKLDYICPKGHKHSISWSNWKQGNRCAICAKNVKFSLTFVKEQFNKEGYTLLSDNYINQKQKLYYRCKFEHEHSITFSDWYNGGYRCPTCYAIKISGSGNPSWKGGISLEPYCDAWKDKEYKQDLRDRDGNRCLNPYCYGTDKVLAIHHVDYNKKNCHPSNLITVCNSCNKRANFDRAWHKSWYQAILRQRYNYNY